VYATAEIIRTSNNYVIIVYSNNEMETNSFLWLQRWVSRSSSIWHTTNNQWLHELAHIHFVRVKRIPRILHIPTHHALWLCTWQRLYQHKHTHNVSIICRTDDYHHGRSHMVVITQNFFRMPDICGYNMHRWSWVVSYASKANPVMQCR